MIDTKQFYNYLIQKQIDFFTGVPDSLLADMCAVITENSPKENHVIAANEGQACAIASGRYLSTGKFSVVYMQNSGIGNAVNPLLSLADEDVYGIPMLLVIGWRGEPGVKDEPQHVKQGKVTLPILESMGIPYLVLEDEYQAQIDHCIDFMTKNKRSIALVIRKGSFSPYKPAKIKNEYSMTREEVLEIILNELGENDFIVSTTGKTSREIWELREKMNQEHSNDFLTVGSMGHTSSIAFGLSLGTANNVWCIDGDGSFLMHMGGFPIIAKNKKNNLKYIMLNNGSHESVGEQPTVALQIKPDNILKASGFKKTSIIDNAEELKEQLNKMKNNKADALIVLIRTGSRADLGRPKATPQDNKNALMKKIMSKK